MMEYDGKRCNIFSGLTEQRVWKPSNVYSAVRLHRPEMTDDPITGALDKVIGALKPFDEKTRKRLLTPFLRDAHAEIARLDKKLGVDQMKLELQQGAIEALEDLERWEVSFSDPVLESNDCSRLHILLQDAADGKIIDGTDRTTKPFDATGVWQHTFVMRHDWAAAFTKAEGMDGEIRLPYDLCAFEFRISGRTVIALANNAVFEFPQGYTIYVASKGYWYSPALDQGKECALSRMVWDQIRAVCIAMDAEVATASVVRAPHELNAKRVKAGKIPMLDHHVVDLSRRHRLPTAPGSGTGTKKRLHFRRGHWRHYDEHKTWIKWTLVGNPELGFIEKHYAL